MLSSGQGTLRVFPDILLSNCVSRAQEFVNCSSEIVDSTSSSAPSSSHWSSPRRQKRWTRRTGPSVRPPRRCQRIPHTHALNEPLIIIIILPFIHSFASVLVSFLPRSLRFAQFLSGISTHKIFQLNTRLTSPRHSEITPRGVFPNPV